MNFLTNTKFVQDVNAHCVRDITIRELKISLTVLAMLTTDCWGE